jgi:hypothetical protein
LSEKIIDNENLLEHGAVPEYKPGLGKFLNVVAVILVFILVLVIYLPTRVWEEEEAMQKLGRSRMLVLHKVEDFYYKMAETYQKDPVKAIKIVSALRDSTKADSNYHGEQVLRLDGEEYKFDIIKDLFRSYDTTFAQSYNLKDTVFDTLYTITLWNSELRAFDTTSVSSKVINSVDADTILNTEIVPRPATLTYYNPYYLTEEHATRPLIDEKYIVEFGENQPITIKDPIDFMYEEPRFIFFTFKDTSHGYIKNGEPSWK